MFVIMAQWWIFTSPLNDHNVTHTQQVPSNNTNIKTNATKQNMIKVEQLVVLVKRVYFLRRYFLQIKKKIQVI